MSSTSISDNKPHLNNDLIKSALLGTSDYHYLMTSIVHESLMLKAGYIPDKIGEPLTYGNPHHWQSKAKFPNIGILWVFHAADCGHFTENEAKRIWRYGQILLIREKMLKSLKRIACRDDIVTYADRALLRINEFIYAWVRDDGVPRMSVNSAELYEFMKATITGKLEAYSTDYDLAWAIDEVIENAARWIIGDEYRHLQVSLNEFNKHIRNVDAERGLV